MGKMKNLYIDALNVAAETEQKAYYDYFNSVTDEEEAALTVYTFDPEDEEYLDAEDDGGYYR